MDTAPDGGREETFSRFGYDLNEAARRGDLEPVRCRDAEVARCIDILLRQTKNGEGRIVYLNESAVAALNSLPFTEGTRTTDRLFPGISPDKVSRAF